ncbi:hypothetical protein EYF80_000033 [Liparis tanakae]|uniref:Uncharacterized protein n=1 Tax=Liparis tanakae TaxID=230148 RepID=A0A4Z2JGZ3_9TELE|nr:hypothetical protein EYF80_000033 [Liparis tanakae]
MVVQASGPEAGASDAHPGIWVQAHVVAGIDLGQGEAAHTTKLARALKIMSTPAFTTSPFPAFIFTLSHHSSQS